MRLKKILEGLEQCSKRKGTDTCSNCPYFSGCNTEYGSFTQLATEAKAALEEMNRIIKLYAKCEGYLAVHGWDWTKFDEYRGSSSIEDADWYE